MVLLLLENSKDILRVDFKGRDIYGLAENLLGKPVEIRWIEQGSQALLYNPDSNGEYNSTASSMVSECGVIFGKAILTAVDYDGGLRDFVRYPLDDEWEVS